MSTPQELVLTVESYNGLPPPVAVSVRVAERDCVVGRHPDCQLELPDPECLVSGHHAVVRRQGDEFVIVDTSTNGTCLNDADTPITPNQPTVLHHGDRITIGSYVLTVALEQGPQAAPMDPFAVAEPGPLPGMPDPGSAPDIMDLLGAGPQRSGPRPASPPSEPFEVRRPSIEDMHFTPPPTPPPPAHEPTPVEEPSEPAHRDSAGLGPAEVPDNYDLLADDFAPTSDRTHPGAAPQESSRSATQEHDAAASPPDTEAGAGAGAGPGPFEPEPEMPFPGLGLPGQPLPPADQRPPPRPEPPPPDQRESAPSAGAGARGGASEDLAAFLSGLGTGDPSQIRDSEAMMRLSGQLLRAMTEGLMAVMMARASFKSELRLEVTTITSRDNNPFQFCVDPDDALERLLWRPSRGFLDPAAAVRKTFDDIQAHQMAMIAGLRAALRALLARFQPEELERHFEHQSQLEKLLPMARKSKCWDLFVSTFDQVADDAAEDFLRLFGDAFNRAYEEQTRRLTAAQRRDSV